MFFRNARGNYTSLNHVDRIDVAPAAPVVGEPARWHVYAGNDSPGNRLAGDFRTEKEARDAARKLAESVGDVFEVDTDDTERDSEVESAG